VIRRLKDILQRKAPAGVRRAAGWRSLRRRYLKAYPQCALCGGWTKLEVHHKVPFHVDPTRELAWDNLITLCEAKRFGVNCHLLFGHLGNYRRANEHVDAMVFWFRRYLGAAEEEDAA
jgi:5-methylcytosine-specific restriction protein A